MRPVGVPEFGDQAKQMMSAGETLVIERHGEPIGFFVPIAAKNRHPTREAHGQLGNAVDELLTATDPTEDDLAAQVSPKRRR